MLKTKTRAYKSWESIKRKCYNPNCHSFVYYGGRGILVCERWLESFDLFFEDMGECPKGLTLGRIDNNGNYEPSNCRWKPEHNKHKIDHRLKFTLKILKKFDNLEAWEPSFISLRIFSIYHRLLSVIFVISTHGNRRKECVSSY